MNFRTLLTHPTFVDFRESRAAFVDFRESRHLVVELQKLMRVVGIPMRSAALYACLWWLSHALVAAECAGVVSVTCRPEIRAVWAKARRVSLRKDRCKTEFSYRVTAGVTTRLRR